nr:hypothetical protein [Corallococcus macrosporus]
MPEKTTSTASAPLADTSRRWPLARVKGGRNVPRTTAGVGPPPVVRAAAAGVAVCDSGLEASS